MKPTVFFLCLCATCFSCKKDKNYKPANNAISFESPTIGQSNRYVRFVGNGAFSDDTGMEYFNDTLVVDIIGENENGWILRDYYAPGSIAFTDPGDSLQAAKVEEFYLRVDSDTIHLFVIDDNDPMTWQFSRFFFLSTALPIVAGPVKFEQHGWELSPETNDCPIAGKVKNYEQLGHKFGDLNVVKNTCMSPSDGPDYVYAYSLKAGLVQMARLNIWDGKAYGWDLIPGSD